MYLFNPMKTSENLMVFWGFPGVLKGWIGNKWVKRDYIFFNLIRAQISIDFGAFEYSALLAAEYWKALK